MRGQRLLRWLRGAVRQHARPVVGYVAILAIAAVLGFIPALDPYGKIAWLIAVVMLALGAGAMAAAYASYLVRGVRDTTSSELEQLGSRVGQVEAGLASTAANDVSLDLVSVLRHSRPLWTGESGFNDGNLSSVEHGHAVLLALLVGQAAGDPAALRGRTVVEVGSTRERDPAQGSTEKLAIFTALTGMRFVTVDMDPESTNRAQRIFRFLNPSARAVTERGEDYLAESPDRPDFVYLDAFDFDHGRHSEYRKGRYRSLLHTEISDEECWRMHELCAEALVDRMNIGGLVVIDDTWTDEDGALSGKGKLAVPLLLRNGFEVVATAPRAVALKRVTRS